MSLNNALENAVDFVDKFDLCVSQWDRDIQVEKWPPTRLTL